LHYLHAFPEIDGFRAKLRGYLPAVTQFAFGSLWSAFLVFYARSGVLAGSWPFLIVLAAIFVGNELFRDYHSRLLFTSGLFFFALLSYAIFMVPVFTHTIGTLTFILSGVAAVGVFLLFVRLLNWISAERLGPVRWQIRFSGLAVFVAVFGLYFLNLLPPLPLALQKVGIFHTVKRLGSVYYGMTEDQSWLTYLGFPTVIHIDGKQPVFVFCAIFAPIDLATTIVHRWQHYDADSGRWTNVQSVSYRISGGRGKGYRWYTKKTDPEAGLWRVDIDTVDGRLIGRTEFVVVNGPIPPAKLTTVLD
ncbi:MAG: DUF2914 domain-containing protein, partial [Alphaproteobacteria bacterium]|nr:DUF2914 domain-containing protein [Alphaproteobacteria bacterium]